MLRYLDGTRRASERVKGAEPKADEDEQVEGSEGSPVTTTGDADSIARDGATVTLALGGRLHEFVLEPGETIFAGALRVGVALPFSCVAGYCGECTAHLEDGEVDLEINMALTPKQRARGEILTCQAVPRSARCRVRFPDWPAEL